MRTHVEGHEGHEGSRRQRRGGPLALVLLLAGAGIGSAAARADPPPPPRTLRAEVEISESGANRAQPRRVARLGLVMLDDTSSRVAAQLDAVRYNVSLRRQVRGQPRPVLFCELERSESGQQVKVNAAAVVELGRRITFAQIFRPDGSRLEVSVMLQQ